MVAFYELRREVFDALVRCAITSLALQERYSLVAASSFLVRVLFFFYCYRTLLNLGVLSFFNRLHHYLSPSTEHPHQPDSRL